MSKNDLRNESESFLDKKSISIIYPLAIGLAATILGSRYSTYSVLLYLFIYWSSWCTYLVKCQEAWQNYLDQQGDI